LNVPVDYWGAMVPAGKLTPIGRLPKTTVCDRQAVLRAAAALIQADYPLILAGAGIVRAEAAPELKALAERLQARVATSPTAKGIFPENHELSLGVFGFAGHERARDIILSNRVDVLIAAGVSMSETTTFNWDPAVAPRDCLIHLDINVDSIGRNYPVDVPLVGDARTVLQELLSCVDELLGERVAAPLWSREMPLDGSRYRRPDLRASEALPLTPQRWRAEFNEVLPENALVFSDVGGHMLFNVHDLEIQEKQDFVLNLGFGSMGHGTAAPIGAALGRPDRPVFAIVGDACFMMNGMELLTALEYDIPVIWIVENNQMHGISWHGSQMVGTKRPMDAVVYDKPVDIGRIGKAMGLDVWVVDRPGQMGPALEAALEAGRPAMIEVLVDPTISPPVGDRARTIGGIQQ
ncbi:MAG: thiamine pyrophosphate-binding protein, partial [Bradymonadaceae bacterium]